MSDDEASLYEAVTKYVTHEMDRGEQLAREEGGDRHKTVVGFALTILQRRLASSPAAIHESLKRRLKRLEQKLQEANQSRRVASLDDDLGVVLRGKSVEDLEDDLDEQPEAAA